MPCVHGILFFYLARQQWQHFLTHAGVTHGNGPVDSWKAKGDAGCPTGRHTSRDVILAVSLSRVTVFDALPNLRTFLMIG